MTTAPPAPTLCKVITPTGGETEVLGPDEAKRYTEMVKGYTTTITYTERSDLEDLEALIALELSVYRIQRWLLSGKNYEGQLIDSEENSLRLRVQGYQKSIADIKKRLKLDRQSREGDAGASMNDRWQTLAAHCKELGIVRNKQAAAAIEIMQGVFGIVGAFDRSNEEERKRLGFADEKAIVDYLRESKTVFDKIDKEFRAGSQRYWVRAPHLPAVKP